MKFEAILFDCDGVLVDSELLTNTVLCTMLNQAGWPITPQECMLAFIGKTVRSEAALIEARTGQPLTDAWMDEFYARRNLQLQRHLQAIPGAVPAVRTVHAMLGGRIACASGADRFKVEMQLQHVGLAEWFEGRVFSGHEMPATKPAPDVYLAAAAALGVPPQRCLVVEDTVTGVTAGVAARPGAYWSMRANASGSCRRSPIVAVCKSYLPMGSNFLLLGGEFTLHIQ